MKTRLPLLSACMLIAAAPAAWSNGGSALNVPENKEQSWQDQAKSLYNDGVRDVKKADKYWTSAAEQTDARKKAHALDEAKEYYSSALARFKLAVQTDPKLAEAWNYAGYTNRKLGNYDAALPAYEQALKLKPGFPDALEYRGEAFLGLNRVADAKQAYLDLFAGNRELANKLLAAMKGWIETQKTSSAADSTAVADLDKWVQERSAIAGQTASLTREGAASSWK